MTDQKSLMRDQEILMQGHEVLIRHLARARCHGEPPRFKYLNMLWAFTLGLGFPQAAKSQHGLDASVQGSQVKPGEVDPGGDALQQLEVAKLGYCPR